MKSCPISANAETPSARGPPTIPRAACPRPDREDGRGIYGRHERGRQFRRSVLHALLYSSGSFGRGTGVVLHCYHGKRKWRGRCRGEWLFKNAVIPRLNAFTAFEGANGPNYIAFLTALYRNDEIRLVRPGFRLLVATESYEPNARLCGVKALRAQVSVHKPDFAGGMTPDEPASIRLTSLSGNPIGPSGPPTRG